MDIASLARFRRVQLWQDFHGRIPRLSPTAWVYYWRGAEKRTSRPTLLPSDNDVTEGLITWPRRAEVSCAACLGGLGGILGASRQRSFGREEITVSWMLLLSLLIRLWVKEMYPRHARRSVSPQSLEWRLQGGVWSVPEGNFVLPFWD